MHLAVCHLQGVNKEAAEQQTPLQGPLGLFQLSFGVGHLSKENNFLPNLEAVKAKAFW